MAARSTLAEYYNSAYETQLAADEELSERQQHHVQRALGAVRDREILDVGCGTGAATSFLTADNRLYGLDCSAMAVARARARGLQAVVHDIEERFPFEDARFDIVTCRETFEHLVRPLATLREIWRVLKPDGVLFATVPNHFSLDKRWRISLGRGIPESCDYFPGTFRAWDYPHLRFFTYVDIKTFLALGGFRVVRDRSQLYTPLAWVPWEMWSRLRRWSPDLFLQGFQFLCAKTTWPDESVAP